MSTPYHKQTKKLEGLDWFDNENYRGFYDLTEKNILNILCVRSDLWRELTRLNVGQGLDKAITKFNAIKSNPFSEIHTLMQDAVNDVARKGVFSSTTIREDDEAFEGIDLDSAHRGMLFKEPVRPLGSNDDGCDFYTMWNFFDLGELKSQKIEGIVASPEYIEPTQELFEKKYSYIVTVDLSAPEKDIRESFNKWLKQTQTSNKSVRKPSFEAEKNTLINHRVLQYIDLLIYQKIEGKDLTRAELAEIIFGQDLTGLSKLDDSTKPKAMQVLRFDYISWLEHVVNRATKYECEQAQKYKEVFESLIKPIDFDEDL